MTVVAKPEISKILLDLGVEPMDVYAVDNAEQTYISALIEGINIIELSSKDGKGDERSRILRDELKQIRERKRKRNRVDINKVFSRTQVSPAKITAKRLAPASEKSRGDMMGGVLDAILKLLQTDFKREKKEDTEEEKQLREEKRIKREKLLETTKNVSMRVGKKLISTILKPFTSIFDRIGNFLQITLLGTLFNSLLWFADDKNQDKLSTLIRIFKNLSFPLGVATIAGSIALLTPIISGILAGVKTAFIAMSILAAGIAVLAKVGEISNKIKGEEQGFSGGGFVSGPDGVDKVPARLTAGEFVMSKGAVQKYGANTLAAMNAAGGGTNVPTPVNGYNEGGLVGGAGLGGLRTLDMLFRAMQSMKGLSSIFSSQKNNDEDLTDDEINELYKDVTNPKDPNILERLLGAKDGPFNVDPRTTKSKGTGRVRMNEDLDKGVDMSSNSNFKYDGVGSRSRITPVQTPTLRVMNMPTVTLPAIDSGSPKSEGVRNANTIPSFTVSSGSMIRSMVINTLGLGVEV